MLTCDFRILTSGFWLLDSDFYLLYFQSQLYGAVIRAGDFGHDGSRLHAAAQAFAHKKIVQTPPHIALPRAGLHIPPGIPAGLGAEQPEGIDIAGCQKPVYPGALLGKKARHLLVLFWPGQVDFVVGCIDIAADDDMPAFFPQCLNAVKKSIVEIHFKLQALGRHAAIGEIHIKQNEAAEINSQRAALGVEALDAKAAANLLRLQTAVQSHAAVAFALGSYQNKPCSPARCAAQKAAALRRPWFPAGTVYRAFPA